MEAIDDGLALGQQIRTSPQISRTHVGAVTLDEIGVGDVLAFEGGQEVLASAAVGAVMAGRLVDPETGLPPDIEVAHRVERRLGIQAGGFFVATALAAALIWQGPGDMEGV